MISFLFQVFLLMFLGTITPSLGASQQEATPINAPSANTIVGAWEHTLSKNPQCKEIYIFRPDGTLTVLSGNRRFEDRYEINAQADERGRFKLTGITQVNTDGIDCAGRSRSYVGKPYTVYIQFEGHDKCNAYGRPGDTKESWSMRRITH